MSAVRCAGRAELKRLFFLSSSVFAENAFVKTLPSSRLLVFLASLLSVHLLLLTPRAEGTAPPDSTTTGARITFADGETLNLRARDRFRPIALAPGETILIELQLPPAFANKPAVAQALDGGQLSVEDFVIAADGSASLTFQVRPEPGQYRLLLSARGRSVTLEFEVAQP